MNDRFDGSAMLLEQIHHRAGVPDVHVTVFVIANVRDQIVARFFCGSFGPKELSAHIVVDSDDARAFAREAPDRFRPDQSRGTCDDDRTHHVEFTGTGAASVLRETHEHRVQSPIRTIPQ